MSEMVEPVVVMENEDDIDPGTETPYEETSAAKSEVTEKGENQELSQDQNNETAEAEKQKKEAEKWKKRERDFFLFKTAGEEKSDDEPLQGEELQREITFHNKMRNQFVQYLKNQQKVPSVPRFEPVIVRVISETDRHLEDLEGAELDLNASYMPHPYPLRWTPLPGGRFKVYQGLMPQDIRPIRINGRYEVDPRALQQTPRTTMPRL